MEQTTDGFEIAQRDLDLRGPGAVFGTQQHGLTEDDFRGIRFKEHPFELRGNNDLLSLTRPGKRRLAISGLYDVTVLNPAVDRRLAAIVAMAIDDRTSVRYRDGGAFAKDLDRYLQRKSVAALPINSFQLCSNEWWPGLGQTTFTFCWKRLESADSPSSLNARTR